MLNTGETAPVAADGVELQIETAEGASLVRPQVVKGRFAPSPTGRMHAGNIFAYLSAWLIAKSQGGSIVLRIEDLDAQRSKQCYVDALLHDFENLGLFWDEGPYFQHDRAEAYQAELDKLAERGLTYPCYCTRADLHAASAPHAGDRFMYAGTCRDLTPEQCEAYVQQGRHAALRVKVPEASISLEDGIQGRYSQDLQHDCGDFVVRRGDGAFAYQLAVVVDDAEQGVTSVVRGVDLLSSSPQQMYLQQELGLPSPEYCHVPLLVAEDGRRLSKRNEDASLDIMMQRFGSPEGVIGHIAGISGLAPTCEPITPQKLLESFDLAAWRDGMPDHAQIVWHSID